MFRWYRSEQVVFVSMCSSSFFGDEEEETPTERDTHCVTNHCTTTQCGFAKVSAPTLAKGETSLVNFFPVVRNKNML